jgi:hypothetical protein
VQLSSPHAYYADRDVPHTAQGDIYAGIPFVHATLLTPAFEAAGARKRPDAREPDLGVVTSHEGLGVVLHYTCARQYRERRGFGVVLSQLGVDLWSFLAGRDLLSRASSAVQSSMCPVR